MFRRLEAALHYAFRMRRRAAVRLGKTRGASSARCNAWRRLGVRIGGISSGAYVLAAAGCWTGSDFTIHWEHAPVLAEAFPHLVPRQARYVIDGNRITCAGGVAPLEMMRALIAERMGS